MAVYTRIPEEKLNAFLGRYVLGKLTGIQDILTGVENSNFLLTTDKNKFILTIYEKRVKADELPFFIGLMHHLAEKGIPCPEPVADRDGNILQRLCDKPAAIVSFLNGRMTDAITPGLCRQVGTAMANMHIATDDFKLSRHNALSLDGWAGLISRCLEKGDTVAHGLTHELVDELRHLINHWPDMGTLPFGVIHADLFPDNVFFEQGELCGIIDFYFACSDFLAYDLAIAMNAWCFDAQNVFQTDRARAMMEGYESVRPLQAEEKDALPILLRGAALRFLLTRLYDLINHPAGALVKPKDPLEYRAKLHFFKAHPYAGE